MTELDLPDNSPNEEASGPVTAEWRSEVQARLAHHMANPDESTFTLAEIKAKAGIE